MGNLLYTVAVVLIILWAVGFFAYSMGGIIHILLVIAVISIILRIIRGERIWRKWKAKNEKWKIAKRATCNTFHF